MTRVAIVGAGVVGLAAALDLASVRGTAVTVYDAGTPLAEASGAANGALTPYSDHGARAEVVALAEYSVGRYTQFLDTVRARSGRSIDHDVDGVLELAMSEEEVGTLRQTFDLLAARGAPADWVEGKEVRRVESAISPMAKAAIRYPTESRIDLDQLRRALLLAVEESGATVYADTEVLSVSPRTHDLVALETTAGAVEVDHAAICTGYGPNVVREWTLPEITRIRGEIVEVRGPADALHGCLYWQNAFLTPRRDGRVLVGTTYVPYVEGMSTDKTTVSVGGAVAMLNDAVRILPSLRDFEVGRVWKGWRPATSSGLPAISRHPAMPVTVATGFGGLGYTLAAAVGPMLRHLVLEEPTEVDLSPFSVWESGN